MEKTTLNVLYGLMCIIIIFSGLLTHSFLNSLPSSNQNREENANQNPQQTINRTFSFKAAIIDHLSVSDPDPLFIKIATNILKAANFTVDYYPRDQVMIDLYRNLAALDYSLIIFRVHSGREPVTFFFSGEQYNATEYVPEQLNDQIGQAWVPGDESTYFSIRPLFIKYAMRGSFYKTVIIAMGCGSLHTTEMAEAFIGKGAAAYIGWNASLTAFHGDLATLSVMQHLLLERETVNEAVDSAMKEVGPCQANEPGTISVLSFYPFSSESYIIP
jgi:hypothetical protein